MCTERKENEMLVALTAADVLFLFLGGTNS